LKKDNDGPDDDEDPECRSSLFQADRSGECGLAIRVINPTINPTLVLSSFFPSLVPPLLISPF
jgi:hypothetical protein